LTLPLTLIAANAGEWRVHRDLFHHRQRILRVMYQKHTVEHHRAFVRTNMRIRERKEIALVLAPIWGVPLIVLSTTLSGLLLGAWLGRNVGALYIATCALFAAGYEAMHMTYHLDPEGPIGRRRLIARLREHHATHHDPELMQRYNFNVTVPLWDWVRGTIYRG
jgi:sterol desaturase/sphingolipid hydroxylase (fatty acid hydroxylase superfamily)